MSIQSILSRLFPTLNLEKKKKKAVRSMILDAKCLSKRTFFSSRNIGTQQPCGMWREALCLVRTQVPFLRVMQYFSRVSCHPRGVQLVP